MKLPTVVTSLYIYQFPTRWPFGGILRTLLCSWGFSSNCLCPIFLEDSEVVCKIDLNVCELGFSSSGLLGVTSSCCWVRCNRIVRLVALLRVSHPLVPCVKGAPKFLEGLIRDYEHCPGSSSPFLLFSSSCDKEGLDGMFSILYCRITWVVVYTFIL